MKKLKEKKIGRIHIWNIKKLDGLTSSVDAVFVENDKFYSRVFEKNGFIVIPEWISMTLDISQPVEKIYSKFSKSAKEDLRRMKKYRYPYEISSDLNKLEMFYYQMYLPYIISRHGKQANCASFYTFRHLFERGSKLMLIKHDDEYIFGSLFLIKKNRVHALYSGIMERKTDYLKKGVGAASYYFSILWAKENKAKFIDFGISRAFLNDGLFRYKKSGAQLLKKLEMRTLAYLPLNCLTIIKGLKVF